jgi:hypothetical protein
MLHLWLAVFLLGRVPLLEELTLDLALSLDLFLAIDVFQVGAIQDVVLLSHLLEGSQVIA